MQTFEEFNVGWTQEIMGLGIDLDRQRLAGHPYERANMLPLFVPGWERRSESEE